MGRLIACVTVPGMLLFPFGLAAQTVSYVEFGPASGEPGEVVSVPVYAEFDARAHTAYVFFRFDPSRLEFLGYEVAGSDIPDWPKTGIVTNTFDPGDGLFGLNDQVNGSSGTRSSIPPGRWHLGFLRFRIRARAPLGAAYVEPVRRVSGTAGDTRFELETPRGRLGLEPEILRGTQVTVEAPKGPRPVADLTCRQFLDRVELAFEPVEEYDALEILRDGAHVATLPGDAAGYSEPAPGLGTVEYGVIARRGTETSVAVSCALSVVSPRAPSVEDLTCADGRLTWTNPVPYDRLEVWRDGALFAVLPGDAESFTDPQPPQSMTVYEVTGELEGFRSPPRPCIDRGVWMIEAGDVEIPPDATRVVVPIYLTVPRSIQGFDCYLDIDMEVFELDTDPESAIEGTVGHPDPELLLVGPSTPYGGEPAAGVAWDYFSPTEVEKDLQPGLRRHVLNFVFRVRGALEPGRSYPVLFFDANATYRGERPEIVLGQNDVTLVPGVIRVSGAGPEAVQGLLAAVEGGEASGGEGGGGSAGRDVRLSWRNRGVYEGLRIERNGGLIAELPGDATSYVDRNVPGGVYTYKVTALAADGTSLPRSTIVATSTPRGAFLRGDADRNGRIELTDAVALARFLFQSGEPVPCEDAADADDSGDLNLTDAIVILEYLFVSQKPLPAPGTVVPWFDPTPDLLGCEG